MKDSESSEGSESPGTHRDIVRKLIAWFAAALIICVLVWYFLTFLEFPLIPRVAIVFPLFLAIGPVPGSNC